MMTKKLKFVLFITTLFLFNCSVDNIGEETEEENVFEEVARYVEPGTGLNGGGTDDGSGDNEGDKDDNGEVDSDSDGDGDPDSTDPEPNNPCVFTEGSIGDPSNPIWANADCDGDGIANGYDAEPFEGF